MQHAAKRYFQTQVTTTSQGELVVMLYDGAIKFLNRAKERLAENDMAGKGIAISKAMDVINELDSSLNRERGGTLADNLHGLYMFCSNHLFKANLKKSSEMIDDVLRVLSGLRSAYAEIAALPEAQAAAQEAAANMNATAILPPRAQVGAAPTGGLTPAPGANARIRNMYAAQAAQAGEPGVESPVPPSVAPAQPPAAQEAAPEQSPPPFVRSFGQGAGFAGKMSAKLYRNMEE